MTLQLKDKQVLVTGGAGYIGGHVVRMLQEQGNHVRILDLAKPDQLEVPGSQFIAGDIRDAATVKQAVEGCQVVLHLAANPNLWTRNPDDFETVNHQGTRRVLEAAAQEGVERTVYVSTESILTPRQRTEVISESVQTTLADMIGPYCRSKWLAEQAAFQAAEAGQPVVIVRPSVPVGPGDHHGGPLTRMMRDFQDGRVKGWMPGQLNLVDVRDVAEGTLLAAERGEIGQAYLLVNENWTIREFMQYLAVLFDRKPPRARIPYSVALGFAYFEEAMCRMSKKGRIPMATVTGVKLTRRCFHFDGQRSREALGIASMRCCRQAVREMHEAVSA